MSTGRRFSAQVMLLLTSSLLMALTVALPSAALARPIAATVDTSPRQIIVRFAPQAEFDFTARSVAHLRAGGTRVRSLRGMPGYDLVAVPKGASAGDVMRRYRMDPSVLYVEPNHPVSVATVPNDPRFPEQWALENTGQNSGTVGADIGAPQAWTMSTGSPDVLVAVIDTGVDYYHPDLAPNMWGGLGWNFVDDNADPMDINGHGTHVAGTIAAVTDDGFGVAGVAWEARVMALKALSNSGSGWTSDIAEAVTFASDNGADIINMSLGGDSYSQVLHDAIAASDALVVCAAGNSGADNDSSPVYPASYDLDNIVSVAATDSADKLASFSNHGAASVDIGAPGVAILSTVPGATYSATTVFSDTMDTLDAWDTSEFISNPWALSSERYASPSRSAAHAPAGGYAAGEQSWIVTHGYISLTDADRVKISFNAALDTVSTDDLLVVAAEREGGHWEALGYVSGSTGGAFYSYSAEFSQLAGSRARLAFVFVSGETGGGAGVWVDDVKVYSLTRDGGADYGDAHGYKSGTSMAAPHVAGVAALLKSYAPGLTAEETKSAILTSAESIDSLKAKTLTGGRLDAARTLSSFQPANAAPVAADISYVVEAGEVLVVDSPGVLVNDEDADGDPLTAQLESGTASGALTLAPDGGFTYTADDGFSGTDTFTYRAFDGTDVSDVATVTILVMDDITAPVSTVTFDPAVPGGRAGWYTTAPAVTITASDEGGSGVAYVEWKLAAHDTWTRGATVSGITDGEHTLHFRAADNAGNVEDAHTVAFKVDAVAPVTRSDAEATYDGHAAIVLTAADDTSGVAATYYTLGGGAATAYTAPLEIDEPGSHELTFWSVDVAGNTEAPHTVLFEVLAPATPSVLIAGEDRYLTAIKGSRYAFDTSDAVVIVTGGNFADALGGAALAGVLDAPLLLTRRDSLPAPVADEIGRLKASKAYVLGGTGAVSDQVASSVRGALSGSGQVTRIAGTDRYDTASKVAAETIRLLGGGYTGYAFIATGANFPDALGASSIAAAKGMPVILADPRKTSVSLPSQVERVIICGGTVAVPASIETSLESRLGAANVTRLAGADRFDTAARVAAHGTSELSMAWDGVGITTGRNFPDALAAGPVLGTKGAVMLLTDTGSVPAPTRSALDGNKDVIDTVHFFGGDRVVPPSVRTTVLDLVK